MSLPKFLAAAMLYIIVAFSAPVFSQTVIHYDSGYTLRNNQLGHYYKMASFTNEARLREYTYWKSTGSVVNEFMNFRVIFPNGYNKKDTLTKYPLILMLHGAGESGRSWAGRYDYGPDDLQYDNNSTNTAHAGPSHVAAVLKSASDPKAFPGIVIMPQVSHSGSWQNGWEDGAISNDMRMTIGIVEHFISTYNVDQDRVIVHGLSNGAKGTWDAAAKRPDLFAAILPMSGVGSEYEAMTDILVTMPTWLFQGGTDTNPRPQAAQDLIDLLKSKGAAPIYTFYPTLGHGTWTTAYAEANFFPWIRSQNKKNIYVFGGTTELCENGSIKLGFSDGFLQYQWTYNGVDIPGATTRYYTLNQTGTYKVKFLRRNNKWAESYPIQITPKSNSTYSPVLTNTGTRILPIDFSGAKNDTLKLTATEGFPSYYWYKDGVAFDTTTSNIKIAYFLNASGTAGTTAEAGNYAVKVRENSGCLSLLSSPVAVTYTSPHVTPNAPTVATNGLTAVSETEVKITWTDNSTNEEYFEIWRNRNNSNGYTSEPYRLVAIVPANSTSYNDKGLRPMAKYFYRVRSAGSGDGRFAVERTITLPNDLIKPSSPGNLTVTNITDTQISISWDASTDNDRVAKYEVYQGSTLVSNAVTATSYTITNLAPNTTYFVNVRAVDSRGNFSDFPGEAIQVTTLTPQNGLFYSYYEPNTVAANFTLASYFTTTQTPVKQGVVSNFDISVRNKNIKFVFVFEGYIQIDQTGNYNFFTRSDDGSRLYLDGVLQIDNDAVKSGPVEKNKVVNITTTGKHAIRVEYFYANSLTQTLTVSYDPPGSGTGLNKQVIPNSKLFRTGATPISYYSKATGNLQDLSTWGTNTNGTGTAPPNFTNGFQYYYIQNRTGEVNLASAWAVTGTGSKITVGTGITLNLNAALTGKLEATGNATINLNNTTIPSFGVLATTSTVNFNVDGAVPSGSYGNLNLNTPQSTKTLPLSSIKVKGNLSVADQVAIQGSEPNLSVVSLDGNLSFLGSGSSLTSNQLYSIIFKGGKAHTLTVNPDEDLSIYQLTLDYGDALSIDNGENPVNLYIGNANGGGLVLETGSILQLDNNNLVMNGNVSINPDSETGSIAMNSGDLTLTTTSTLSSNLLFSDTYNNINNLTLSSTGAAEFNLLSLIKAYDLVTLTRGELNTYNGNMILVSNASGSARIGPLLSGAKITGDITYQRFMPGEGRIYRYIASPIKGMKVADIQKYIPVTGIFTGRSTGTGLASNTATMFNYNESGGGWLNFPPNGGTNQDSLRIGKGYAIFVREGTNPTTWEVTGNPYQGSFIFPLTGGTSGQDNGWNLLGNPYPAPIQWTGSSADGKWSSMQNVSNTVSVRENFGTEYRWRVWNGTTGNLENGIIAPGQSFWVQTTSATPSLIITENAKFTSDGEFHRASGASTEALEVTMTNGTLVDETYIQTAATASDSYNKFEDAIKQSNTYFNLSSKSKDGISLAINIVSSDFCKHDIPLNIDNAAKGNYTLKFNGINTYLAKAYLVDAFLGTQVELTNDFAYSFSITDNVLSKGTRFTITLQKPEVESIQSVGASSVCDSSPIVNIENTQADVEYQAFFGTEQVSDKVLSTGGAIQLSLNKESLGNGTFLVEVKAGYGFTDCAAVNVAEAISVTIDSLSQPKVSVAGNKLTTAFKSNYKYQWYLDGTPLDGQTQPEVYPSSHGVYNVEVTNGSCAKFSDNVSYFPTANEAISEHGASASPNPFVDKLVVNLQGTHATKITIANVVGDTVLERPVSASDESVTLDLSGLPQGTYVVIIGITKIKVIKKA
ncbi:fibronectin type III domain-containing protein [Ohtaekwangia koreensis]|uniref:Prolyl oligopeptidase family protein n=1 Tax=Ohtaekwangia koreensis TaxID=688867 RepID=A0A1T5M2I2_9BACT|nr:PA14 domain-containing protein [Ohtaekwangia koreensis]SKC82440.1 Prolyl oligopeptidase family protein [Ohtaekwangia koreensis]